MKLICPICAGTSQIEVPGNRCLPFFTCPHCASSNSARLNHCIFCEFSEFEDRCPVAHTSD